MIDLNDLLEATFKNNLKYFENISQNDEDIDTLFTLDESGGPSTVNTPLILAIRFERLAIVQMLLDLGANIDEANDHEETPLYIAILMRNFNLVRYLVFRGANVNLSNHFNATPLHIAAETGQSEIVEYLITHNAQIDARNKLESTPLIIAANNGHKEVVMILLKHHAAIDLTNLSGVSALYNAVFHRHNAIALLLIQKGANVNWHHHTGLTPLQIAVEQSNFQLAKCLIEHHAAIINGADTVLPLETAALQRDIDCIKLLIKAHLDQNELDSLFEVADDYPVIEKELTVNNLMITYGHTQDKALRVIQKRNNTQISSNEPPLMLQKERQTMSPGNDIVTTPPNLLFIASEKQKPDIDSVQKVYAKGLTRSLCKLL